MTPTPEDIALAEEMDEYMSIDLDLAARLIAAHTAPLRELAEIGRLYLQKERSYEDETLSHDLCLTKLDDAVRTYLAKETKP